jgi:phytoene dehydrogenase-like protein
MIVLPQHQRRRLVVMWLCLALLSWLLLIATHTDDHITVHAYTVPRTKTVTTISKSYALGYINTCYYYDGKRPITTTTTTTAIPLRNDPNLRNHRRWVSLLTCSATNTVSSVTSNHHHHYPNVSSPPDEETAATGSCSNSSNNTSMVSQILDQALVLRLRVVHAMAAVSSSSSLQLAPTTTTAIATNNHHITIVSWQWLLQQLDESIIPYLIQQYRSFSLLESSSSTNTTRLGNGITVVQQQLDNYEQLFQAVTTSVHSMTTTTNVEWMTNSDGSSTNDEAADSDAAATPFTPLVPAINSNTDDNNDLPIPTAMRQPTVDTENIDVIIIGSGLSGLCAGAILNTVYQKKVAVFESHSLPGGCAHAFTRTTTTTTINTPHPAEKITFTFDSGPSILLGCSTTTSIPNALQQVLQIVQQNVTWIPYSGWNMIERMNDAAVNETKEWKVSLGPTDFINGPLYEYGGAQAVSEFYELRNLTQSLTMGASIPAMSMRSGSTSIVPLIVRHFSTLLGLIQQGETVTGTFAPYMDGPLYTVKSQWLRNWLDALAFSLSGLPASRTAAAAMAFVLQDMHRANATLDYPKGGMGEIVNALVRAVEQGPNGSRVYVNQHVSSIDGNADATKIVGVTLRKNSQKLLARNGVICNAPVWSLRTLIPDERIRTKLNMGIPLIQKQPKPPVSWTTTNEGSSIHLMRNTSYESSSRTTPLSKTGFIAKCETIEMTASFIHLHIALNVTGLELHKLAAHYTVMDRSLSGDPSVVVNGIVDGPCSICNMIAVSNPCVLDPTLAPEGHIVIHAYGAGNEPYEIWEGLQRDTPEYIKLKEERAEPLWRAVECIIPDVRNRVVLQMIGTPLTHERFLRRPRGTYGSVTEDYLRDGATPYKNLLLASDSIFPGIGVPAVAIVGASAANSMVDVFEHLFTLRRLEQEGKLI